MYFTAEQSSRWFECFDLVSQWPATFLWLKCLFRVCHPHEDGRFAARSRHTMKILCVEAYNLSIAAAAFRLCRQPMVLADVIGLTRARLWHHQS